MKTRPPPEIGSVNVKKAGIFGADQLCILGFFVVSKFGKKLLNFQQNSGGRAAGRLYSTYRCFASFCHPDFRMTSMFTSKLRDLLQPGFGFSNT